MNINTNGFQSIEQITGQYLGNVNPVNKDVCGPSFKDMLFEATESKQLTFSKHATERLSDRNIDLTTEQLERLSAGSRKASEKGIKESLVLMDNLAFIVNTKNNTVITAMNSDNQDENVYTNIDGAVVI